MKISMIIFMYSSSTAAYYIILPADIDTKHFLLSLKFFTHQHPLLKSDNKKNSTLSFHHFHVIQIAKFERYAHGHVTALLGDIIHKFLFQKQRI